MPRPRSQLLRLVPGCSKDEASAALRATGGNVERASTFLLKARRVAAEAALAVDHLSLIDTGAAAAAAVTVVDSSVVKSSAAAAAVATVAPVRLTPQQAALVDRVRRGESVFITGEAGTGKSVVTRAIAALFHPDDVAITAPTGIAALNVDGLTIHSWSGVGLGKGDTATLLEGVHRSRKAIQRWLETRCLIIDVRRHLRPLFRTPPPTCISLRCTCVSLPPLSTFNFQLSTFDSTQEVSMLTAQLFQSLADIGAAVRDQSTPFGGLQLVCVGDFCQLPPVANGCVYCFSAPAWKALYGAKAAPPSILTTQLRQAGDVQFAALLNEMRRGVLCEEARRELMQCHVSVKPRPLDGISATKVSVQPRNASRMFVL
tara:strand:- start:623 stop:1741 length:1119 start_codon:yes stop_codon:yes gene_type:complete